MAPANVEAQMRFRMMKRGQTGWGTPVLARPRDARALMRTFLAAGTGLAAAVALGGFAVPAQGANFPGAVYTMTNSPSGNAIEAFARDAGGSLTPAGTYPTGGS